MFGRKNGHPQEFAIIGLGRFGSSLGIALMQLGHSVVGIDTSKELVQRYSDQLTQTLQLDSSDTAALREIDITSYPTVIVAIGTNLEASLMAIVNLKQLGVQQVIAKAPTQVHRDIMIKIGADRVVLPEHEAGQNLADDLSAPKLKDRLRMGKDELVGLVEIPAKWAGVQIKNCDLASRPLKLLAIRTVFGPLTTFEPEYRFERDDAVLVMGTKDAIEALADE